MPTAREVALQVLQMVEKSSERSDRLLRNHLEASTLERLDRALATELVNGVLRWQLQLDSRISLAYHHKLEAAAPVMRNILRLGAYQLLFLTKIPRWAAVNESVKLARKYKGERMAKVVNGVLRHLDVSSDALETLVRGRSLADQLSLEFSHPAWLIERWLAFYGEAKTRQLLHYNNQAPLMGFRVNRLQQDAEEFLQNSAFAEAIEPCELPYFFLSREFSLFEDALQEGRLSVQNPTQALAPLLLNPQPQNVVIDLCAAPGGKATFMAELMQNQGEVIAVDRYEPKLRKLESHAQALGLTIIRTVAGDARSFTPNLQADALLLDAPCSGSGVIGRRAELRWKIIPAMIAELQQLQAELLDHAATLLKPSGRFVYATCSIEPEENEKQIEAFLQRHPNFVAKADGRHLTLPGDRTGYDGGFCQLLIKRGEE